MQGLVGRVVDRLAGGRVAARTDPGAIAALDVGTEFAKALVVTTEPGRRWRAWSASCAGSGASARG